MKIFSKIKVFIDIFTLIITIAGIIAVMFMFKKNNRFHRRKWGRLQHLLMGYKQNVKGEIDEDAQLVIVNHQSAVDVVVMEELHPKDLCWIAKKEVDRIPYFGQIMKIPKMIAVERADKRSLVKMYKEAKQRIDDGRVIIIFPEGTRGNGEGLLRFKQGAKFVAEKLNLKVQPVVIAGARDVFDSQNLKASFGTINVHFLPSITPKQNENWYEDVQKDMAKVLSDELADIRSHR